MPNKVAATKSLSFYLLWTCFVLVSLLLVGGYYLSQRPVPSEYMWVQYGPNDSWIARVITSKEECPSLTIDEKQYRMSVRAPIDNEVPVATCELILPNTARQISLGDSILPVPRLHAKKILVIGDTQNNAFPKLAEVAAKTNPDLIMHLGDYSKEKQAEFSWKSLEKDFFAPTKPLLNKAPWLFVRGNQEECTRGGKLWFRFQDSYSYQNNCIDKVPPFLVNLANLQLLSVDSSQFYDYEAQLEDVQNTKSQLANVQLNPNYWLVTHRPVLGLKEVHPTDLTTNDPTIKLPLAYDNSLLKYTNGQMPPQKLIGMNDTLQKLFTQDELDLMGLSLSGHLDNFESLSFGGALPPQIIAGNQSTERETDITASISGLLLGGKAIKDSKFYQGFGYFFLEEQIKDIWTITKYSPEGKKLFSCELRKRNVICE